MYIHAQQNLYQAYHNALVESTLEFPYTQGSLIWTFKIVPMKRMNIELQPMYIACRGKWFRLFFQLA
jgi:hypothetical protein